MAFNLGTIETKVKVDGLAQFGDDLKRTDATIDAFAQQTSKRFTRVEMDVKAVAKATGQSAQEMQTQLDRAMKSISADTATKSLERMARQMGLAKSEMQALGQQMGLSSQTIETLTGKLSGARSGMSALVSLSSPLAGAIAGAFSVGAIVSFITEIANTKMQFEAFERTLKMVTGSQTGAALAMESLSEVSNRLGLRLTDAADGYKLIAAAARGTTLEGAETKKTFEAVASSASVLGLSASDTNGILLALSQMISKGKVQAEELRGQLGERLPGAFQIAARAMGMTTGELDKLLTSGGLATDVFLPKFTSELLKSGQGADGAGNTTQAAFNRMTNSWDSLKAALGETTAFGAAIAAVNAIGSAADTVANKIRSLSETLTATKQIEDYEKRAKALKDQLGDGQGISQKISALEYETVPREEVLAEVKRMEDAANDLRQRLSENARREIGKKNLAATNKQNEDNLAAEKTGQEAVLDSWASSADKGKALWAQNRKDVLAAWGKAYKGEITQGAMDTLVDEANKKYAQGLEDLAKKGQKGADAAAHFAERSSAYFEQAQDQYDQLAAQLGGDALGAKLAAIERRYDRSASAIRQAMVGAKGSTEELDATLKILSQSKALDILLAQAEAWKKAMTDAANMLGELGRLTGDPAALYGSSMTTAQAWEAEQKKRISAIDDETEREKQLGELRQVMALKDVEARRQAYEAVSAVSSKYWDAEQQRIESHLSTVKASSDDETAYRIYAAQEWDAYNKKLLEQQAQYSGDFGKTVSAKLSLAFGGYESDVTRAQHRYEQFGDSVVEMTGGTVDAVAGGLGDMVRAWEGGCLDAETLWRNMLSRMTDAFASFLENLVKQQIRDTLGSLFSSGSGQGGTSSTEGGAAAAKDFAKTAGKVMATEFSGGSNGWIKDLAKANAKEMEQAQASPSGYTQLTSGASAGGALASGAKSLAGTTSAISSVLGTVGTALGAVGAIGGLIGLAVSLFGEKKEEIKKVASGYNVGYSGGRAYASGVDFYSDGSMTGTGPSDPAITKQISDSFRTAAENLSDFAEELGFATDVLSGFSMPSMNITSDQLGTYISSGVNMMAFKGLMESGLRGAFDAVARDGEVYSDEYERLATSLSSVQGKFEAYGYKLSDVAKITDEQIAELSATNIEVAQGTSQAMLSMAASMGATSDQLALIATNADDGAAALAVTNEQLSTILEADYASQLLDAVGGEDAFSAIMGNLTANIFNSVEAYSSNLDYYAERANTAISKLGDASVTVDNFWVKFDAALKAGLSVDEFEAWGKASSWVANINSVQSALADWDDNMVKVAQSLDQRMIAAQGLDYQAKLAKQMADAEWELAAAREAGYSAAMVARIQEVQAAELAATVAKHQADYQKSLLDAQERIAEASDDQQGLLRIKQQRNALDLQDLAKTYNWSPGSAEEPLFQALQRAQSMEMTNSIRSLQEAVEKATDSLNQDMDVREARLSGDADLADAISKLNAQQEELKKAYEDGLSETTIARLVALQSAEFESYLASIDSSIIAATTSLSSMAESLSSEMGRIIDKSIQAYTTLSNQATTAAQNYHDAASSIYTALQNWAIDDAGGNPDRTYSQTKALFDATFQKAMGGDISAFERLSGLGSSLRDASMKVFGTREEYDAFYQALQMKMGQAAFAADATGDQKSELAKLYDIQVNLYDLLKSELGKDDPNTALLEAIGGTMVNVQDGIETGARYQEVLKNITENSTAGSGGFQVIKDAVQASETSTNALMAQVAGSQAELSDLLASYMEADRTETLLRKRDLYAAQLENSKASEANIFKSSEMAQILRPLTTVYLSKDTANYDVEKSVIDAILMGYNNHTWQGTYLDQIHLGNGTGEGFAQWYRDDGYANYTGSVDWAKMYEYLKTYLSSGQAGWRGWSSINDLIGYVLPDNLAAQIQETAQMQQEYDYANQRYEEWVRIHSQQSSVNSFSATNGLSSIPDSADNSYELLSAIRELVSEVKSLKEGTESANSKIVLDVKKVSNVLSRWEAGGMPATRSVVTQ